jgi:hypothetical protein
MQRLRTKGEGKFGVEGGKVIGSGQEGVPREEQPHTQQAEDEPCQMELEVCTWVSQAQMEIEWKFSTRFVI